ncbi:MAG TPA: heparan-alpha-glucosaminide N-acetyltransferase [Acidobacteriota bacterium]
MKLNPANQQTIGDRSVSARIWEIDFLRGLSIILMVFYHVGYDLSELAGIKTLLGVEINLSSLFLSIAQYFFAGLFIILCGISSTLSRNNIRRALKLLGVAVIITAATMIYNSSSAIHFGILHCLGIGILIYGLMFEKSRPLACAAAAATVFGLSVALALFVRNVPVRFNWLLPLGITSNTYTSLDYFPLLPWLGVYLAGTALGKSIYFQKRSLIPKRLPETFINTAGRHSLLIYVVHQPVIIAVLYISGLIRI